MATLQDLIDATHGVAASVQTLDKRIAESPLMKAAGPPPGAAPSWMTSLPSAFQQAGSGLGGIAGLAGKGLGQALGGAAGAGAAGAAGATYLAATEAIGKTAQAMEIFGNGALTSQQKMDRFASEFVPGARALIEFRDALSGTNEAIRKAKVEYQFRGLEQQSQFRQRQVVLQGAADVALQTGRATAFGAIPVAPTPLGDRASWQGDLAHQEALRRMERQDEIARARAEVGGAGAALEASQKRLGGLKEEGAGAQGELDRQMRRLKFEQGREQDTPESRARMAGAYRHFGAGRNEADFLARIGGGNIENKAGIVGAGLKAQSAAVDAANAEKLIQGEIVRQKELGVQFAEKESALRKAQIGAAREELSILKNRASLLSTQAVRAGGMQEWEGQQSLQAARFIKEHGLGAAPAFIQQQAGAAFPEWLAKEREKYGQTVGWHKEGVAEGFGLKGDLKEARAAEAKVSTEVRIAVNLDTAILARETAAALTGFVREMILSIKAEMGDLKKAMEAGNIVRNRGG